MNLKELIIKLGLIKRSKKEALTKKIWDEGYTKNDVFISIEDFFDGNTDNGSIGANIYPDHPGIKDFNQILLTIRDNVKTNSLLIRIVDIDGEWPSSDTVYLFGDYTLKEVESLFKKLKPDEVIAGLMYGAPSNIPQQLLNTKAYSIFWD